MNFLTNFKIRLFCKKVGADEFGNEYFQDKNSRRLVVYKGIAEPSKIPAEWHGWIHYTTEIAPVNINTHRYSWQKTHLPNLTGTKNAYAPKGHMALGGKREKVSADYQAWTPK